MTGPQNILLDISVECPKIPSDHGLLFGDDGSTHTSERTTSMKPSTDKTNSYAGSHMRHTNTYSPTHSVNSSMLTIDASGLKTPEWNTKHTRGSKSNGPRMQTSTRPPAYRKAPTIGTQIQRGTSQTPWLVSGCQSPSSWSKQTPT